jgi:hypothetical protein
VASFTAKWRGLDELKKRLQPEPIVEKLRERVREVAVWAHDQLVADTPRDTAREGRPEQTPHTADLWMTPVLVKEPGFFYYTIDHPYNEPGAVLPDNDIYPGRRLANDGRSWNLLFALEHGTVGHEIAPSTQEDLRFFWEKNDVWYRSPRPVNHPGTPAFGMVRKTKVEAEQRLSSALRDALKELGLG